MDRIKRLLVSLFTFPCPFFRVYTPLWLFSFFVLISIDLVSKKIVTNNLNFHLSYTQYKWLPSYQENLPSAFAGSQKRSGHDKIDILGDDGKYIKFRLVFNDRFVFGLGPSLPYIGFFLSFLASCLLLLYRWKNFQLGHPTAWLLVFSGAFGNLIDKLFIKSLETREWLFSLTPKKNYVSGVVDFIECIWFGWDSLGDFFLFRFLAMDTWPTFNFADSIIVVGIISLMFTIGSENAIQE